MKIELTKKRIRDWYSHWKGNIYVAFSGGKDSTVLLDLVREQYPNVPAVFVDTGLEYPEIKEFVRTIENVTTIRPEKNFKQVIEEYGYPVVSKKVSKMIRMCRSPTEKNARSRRLYLDGIDSKGEGTTRYKLPEKWKILLNAPFKVSDKCCDIMKKNPIKKYAKENGRAAITGIMAADSKLREQSYLQTGCNNFKSGVSTPMAFWTQDDVWNYIRSRKLKYCKIYDMGVKHTGCMFCMFGVHMEKGKNRFECMKETHRALWDYCMDQLKLRLVLSYIGVKTGDL